MLRANRLDADRTLLLLIDVQEKLLPLIDRHEAVVTATRKLLAGLGPFAVPVVVTEQYPRGLGTTVAAVREALPATASVVEKPTFSACGTANVREAMDRHDRTKIIVAGIEAHVCVLQTALDLRVMDYDVFVCADAVGSRGRVDYDIALDRMRQEGVIVTTVESALFEICERCDTAPFKQMIDVIKASPPART